jgi:D-lactate dehydrogenase
MKTVFVEVENWEKEFLLKEFAGCTLVDTPLTLENVDSIKDCEILCCFIYSKLTSEILSKLPNLKYITTRSTGFDHIDIEYCKARGIQVSNVPEYGSNTVAEHTFALILSLTRRIYQSVNMARTFETNHDSIKGIDLAGKTMGIIGLGKIGQHVARIAKGFEMKIVAYNRSQDEAFAKQYDLTYLPLEDVMKQSDVISIHLPLNDQTHYTINKGNLSLFKKGVFLINTARGGLIETQAIVQGLEEGIFEGVGLDVLEEEVGLSEEIQLLSNKYTKTDYKTLILEHILMNHPKVIITPHNAFNSRESLMRILDTTFQNISSFEKGTAQNIL